MTTINISLSEQQIKIISEIMKKEGFVNKSEFFRFLVKFFELQYYRKQMLSQEHFYTEEWQQKELEADKDIAEKNMLGPFDNIEDGLNALKK